MIDIENINKTIKKQHILKNVCLHIPEGKIYGLVGNNGSGKTVLLKCILGIYLIDNGTICINGKQRTKRDGILTEASAMIEHPAFLSNYTGMQNLRYLYELNHKKNIPYLKEVMKKVGLDPDSRKKVKNYSLGMKQRLAIAQVLMDDKDILILDEPMNGLDKNGVEEIRKLFIELNKKGKTILLVSHNREDINILCDKVYEMDNGEIQELTNLG